MTFKQFTNWCNERACDGRWGMVEAMVCIDIGTKINKLPFYKREKIWKEQYRDSVMYEIINPIEKKIAEYLKGEKR